MSLLPEDRIAAKNPELLWGRIRPYTDPIWIEYALEGEVEVRAQLAAVRLQAAAQIYRVIAEATEKAAVLLTSREAAS